MYSSLYYESKLVFVMLHENIFDTLDAKMASPLRWKTSIEGAYLTVKFHSVIGFIDYTPSLLKLVQFCCFCDRIEI